MSGLASARGARQLCPDRTTGNDAHDFTPGRISPSPTSRCFPTGTARRWRACWRSRPRCRTPAESRREPRAKTPRPAAGTGRTPAASRSGCPFRRATNSRRCRIDVFAPCGALTGIGISILPLLPQSWMRWCGATWVDTVKSRRRPSPKSSSPLVRRSVRKFGIAVDQRDRARRLGVQEKAAGDDRVAADVVESAAADVGHVAHVGRIDVVVAEEHLHRAQRADASGLHESRGHAATADESGP